MPATRTSIRDNLIALGITPGNTVMVHASMRTVGPIVGGVNTMVQALQDVIGGDGTLVAYLDWEQFFDDADTVDVPVFDKRIAHAARDHGILHETLRTWPGAVRSDHPGAGVVAIGAKAEQITANHPMQYGYGRGSPLEKVFDANGRVLMLGAPLDTITLLHYAEHIAQMPNKRVRRYRHLMPTDSDPQWMDFEEFDTSLGAHEALPDNCFEVIAAEFLASGRGATGVVGNAPSQLFNAAELVPFAVTWMERCVLGT